MKIKNGQIVPYLNEIDKVKSLINVFAASLKEGKGFVLRVAGGNLENVSDEYEITVS